MRYVFEVPGTLPTLNEYVQAERSNRYAAAGMKKRTQQLIIGCLGDAPSFRGRVRIEFAWYRPDMRCDKDNVAFAKKFVLDALQEAGVIQKDSWKLCEPYDVGFAVNRQNPRTVVFIDGEAEGDAQ